jgi:cytochrome P450
MVDYALRTVGRVLFGSDVDDAVPVIRAALPIVSRHVRRRGLTPVRLPRWCPTPAQIRAGRARRSLYQVVDTIIDRRVAGPREGPDLISLLLAARDPETRSPLSRQEVRDQVLIFLLAGHETTSTALACTLRMLGQHPEEQRLVQAEIDDVVTDGVPSVDDLPRLVRTTMAVQEALRLYPPAYALGRLAETDACISGHRIPAGSIVLLAPWATHRRADVWPDPGRYDPRRFEPEAAAGRHRYAYFPFAGGLRGCIGSHFAMTEAVIATATLLARYTLHSHWDALALSADITLRPAGPVWGRIRPR